MVFRDKNTDFVSPTNIGPFPYYRPYRAFPFFLCVWSKDYGQILYKPPPLPQHKCKQRRISEDIKFIERHKARQNFVLFLH